MCTHTGFEVLQLPRKIHFQGLVDRNFAAGPEDRGCSWAPSCMQPLRIQRDTEIGSCRDWLRGKTCGENAGEDVRQTIEERAGSGRTPGQ